MSDEENLVKEETPPQDCRRKSQRHPSSGTRGSISPQIRRELASVFDWMEKEEQGIEAAPLWFQNYMETFKDEMVADITSKVVQSLGVVIENKLAKLKLTNINGNANNNQNRNKMSPKEVFEIKRRRNSRKPKVPGNVTTDKEVIPDKKPSVKTDSDVEVKKVNSTEDIVKETSKVNSELPKYDNIESELTDKESGNETTCSKAETEPESQMLVLTARNATASQRPQRNRKSRPFLRQDRRKKANKAFMKEYNKNASAKRSEENKDDAKSKAAKSEVKCDKVVSECEGKKSESVLPTAASAAVSQTRKSVKELTKQGNRSSRHWLHPQHQQPRKSRRQRRRLPSAAARLAAMADSAASGDARRESLTDPASILLSSLTKRRKSDVASSRHEISATGGGNPSGSATMNGGASRRTILNRRTTRRGLKMRNNGNSCPASSGEDRQFESQAVINKPKSLVLKPNYPVAEKIANYPVVEAKSYPLSPKRDYPISPVKDYPIIPVKDYPLTPVKDYPIAARQDYPIAPVKEFPVVTDDFLKKLLLDGRAGTAVDSSGSKDSGVIDGSVDGETESTTSSLTSSQFHTGCSGTGSSSEDNDIFEEDGYIPLLATTLKHPDTYAAGADPWTYKPAPGSRKAVKSSYETGMKIIPVAPGPEKADSLVLLKANYPVKKKDLLSLEYRVKAGATCNLEIKVADIPAGQYKSLYLSLVKSDRQLLNLKQKESVLHKENLVATSSQNNLTVQAPNCEGIYECTYKLLSKSTKANDSLHMGVKYTFYVTKKMVPPMSSRELEGYMKGSSGCKETELKDVGKDDVFEEAVEAFEVFKDDLADNKAVEVFKDGVIVDNDSGPVSLEKFDDLKEVCIDGPQEADYEVLGFKTLDTQGEIFAEFSPEAALQLAEEVLGIQEDQDILTGVEAGSGLDQPLKVDLEVVPLGRSRSNSFDFVNVEEDCGPLSPFTSLEEK